MTTFDDNSVAIVSMACRVPGASSVEQLWQNLRDGVEAIERWQPRDDARYGLAGAAAADPRWVRARALPEHLETFDARFFGYTPNEATLLDPQQRFFLECCWEALERAGHIVQRPDTLVGVYGGAALSSYLLLHVAPYAARRDFDPLQLNLGNAESFLTTRVSYKLDLRGPSYSVTSACSTSLVAVHLACQALLSRECDVALAGGVSLNLSLREGYRFVEGSVLSPEGTCRPFDAEAQGIVFGSGAGVVALRRLGDALADGATIHAVIRGSATNNDGANRVGYTAPSVEGQAEVVAEALANAGVEPSAIGYLEAHGTGTRMGDPIELRALAKAFGPASERPVCAIGSIKSNLGHLDAAAGVLGLIKAALMVQHGELVPSLGCDNPNPAVDWAGQGFRVQRERASWPAAERFAGVSAFGMGGTNAHVVLSQPPAVGVAAQPSAPQLLLLSTRAEPALDELRLAMADALAAKAAPALDDVAATLACNRRRFEHRLAVVAASPAAAAEALRSGATLRRHDPQTERPVVFLFPGQGSQHPGMAAALHRRYPVFREAFDRCAALLQPHLDVPLATLVFAGDVPDSDAATRLAQTQYAQPALFAVEYALAALWRSFGVTPAAMLGHSVGELVAATLAGVFRLDDALPLVAARGALMSKMPRGKMLSVGLPEAELQGWLGDELELAAVNAPALCVVSGPEAAIAQLAEKLAAEGITHRALHTSHAFHSRAMQQAATAFAGKVAEVSRRAPERPYVSNVTGRRVTAAQAQDPAYWGEQLRRPVRFADGLAEVTAELDAIVLEVGPGRALTTFARSTSAMRPSAQSLAEPKAARDDEAQLLHALGELWLAGAAVELSPLRRAGGRVVHLPTHPFLRQRFWIERGALTELGSAGGSLGEHAAEEAATDAASAGDPARPGAPAAAPARHPRPALATAYVAPTTEDERKVSELWEEVLGLAPVGVDDDFFDLGGHSLLATTIVGRLRELYQIEVPLQRLFEAPTVRGTAQVLGDERAALSVLGDDDDKQELLRLLAEMTDEDLERELGDAGGDDAGEGGGRAAAGGRS